MRKVLIKSDGTPEGTKFFDTKNGQEIKCQQLITEKFLPTDLWQGVIKIFTKENKITNDMYIVINERTNGVSYIHERVYLCTEYNNDFHLEGGL